MSLKVAHKLLFGTQGLKKSIKANIRKFKGYDNDKQANAAEGQLEKMEKIKLKAMADLFCLENNGNKDDLVSRILGWCKKPEDTGRAPVSGRKVPPYCSCSFVLLSFGFCLFFRLLVVLFCYFL